MLNVRAQHGEHLRASIAQPRDLMGHALCYRFEPDRGDSSQQLTLVGEMLVRGVVTNASTPGELTQRKLETLRFAQNFKRGHDNGAAQIAVVVWTLGDMVGRRHGNRNLCRYCTI